MCCYWQRQSFSGLGLKNDFRWLVRVILSMLAFNYTYLIPQSKTYRKTILLKCTRRGNDTMCAVTASAVVLRIVLKPFKMLSIESVVLFMTIYMTFNFAVFYSLFTAFPCVFGGRYGFTPGQQELTFISIALRCVIGFLAVVYIDRRTYLVSPLTKGGTMLPTGPLPGTRTRCC